MAVDQGRYRYIGSLIIDQLEGGYYHPDMLADGRVKDSRYGSSGETMFGIDRKNFGANNTAAARQFWSIIDGANARKTWPWNYKGGTYGPSLKAAAADMIYPEYDKFAAKYLSSKSRGIVESDDRLLYNFMYATWNGAGWFQRFASDFNKAVDSGIANKDQLVQIVLKSRTESSNSLIRQTGNKMAAILAKFSQYVTDYVKKNPVKTVVVVAIVTGMMSYYIWIITRKKPV
jgi:hypothetical protein